MDTTNVPHDDDLVPVPVNNDLLSQLLEMGFSDPASRKALVHGQHLDGALSWLTEHQDDVDLEEPYMVRRSEAEKANRPPLTEEEKAKKVEETKQRLQAIREKKEAEAKAEEIAREKERRERGQMMEQTQVERERQQRIREADRIKREKDEQARERLRLREQLARDKEERMKNKGVLKSALGVDGYNPGVIQYNTPDHHTSGAQASSPSATQSTEERIDAAIDIISRHRSAGNGGEALRLLQTFIRNIIEKPTEEKYRSINMKGDVFTNKLLPVTGVIRLLFILGFEKNDSLGKLIFNGDPSNSLLADTLTKLVTAYNAYKAIN